MLTPYAAAWRLMVEERPAAVLIAGDFVYGASDEPDEDLAKVEEFVRPLSEAGIPTYAVLGNHDYRMVWADSPPDPGAAETLRTTLEESGVRVLKNESVELPPTRGGSAAEPLNLVGVGARARAGRERRSPGFRTMRRDWR